MKRFTFISMLTLLIPMAGMSQSQNTLLDDIYFKPGDEAKVQKVQKATTNTPRATYKNGAKEIVYIDRESPKTAKQDTTQVLTEANDSIMGAQPNNEYEYAQRIRQFHGSKDSTIRVDTVYQLTPVEVDNYIVMNSDPFWWGYNRNYYGGWGMNNYWNSPYGGFGGFGGWGYDPWGYNYYGYGGYYGYGYPYYGYYGYDNYYGYGGYYGYGDYYGYGGYNHSTKNLNPSHNEANRRAENTSNYPNGQRYGNSNTTQSIIGRSSFNSTTKNPYTVVSNSGTRDKNPNTAINENASRPKGTTTQSTFRNFQGNGNGIGLVRTGGTRNTSGLYQNYTNNSPANSGYRTINGSTNINTRPRTATISTSSSNSGNSGISRGNYSSLPNNSTTTSSSSRPGASYSSGSRPSTSGSSSTTYSSGSRSSYSGNSGSSTYSQPSYNNSSYSSGSSSSSSSSSSYSSGSSSSSGGNRGSNGSGNSAGSRR